MAGGDRLAACPTAAVAEVSGFHVVSDTKIDVTLSVERPDPAVVVTCRLIAQAQDLQLVGEQAVSLPRATNAELTSSSA